MKNIWMFFVATLIITSSAHAWFDNDDPVAPSKESKKPKLSQKQIEARQKLIVQSNPFLDASYDVLEQYYFGNTGQSCIRYSLHLQGLEPLDNQALKSMELNCQYTKDLNIDWRLLTDPLAIDRYTSLKNEKNCKRDKMIIGKKAAEKLTDHECYSLWYPG